MQYHTIIRTLMAALSDLMSAVDDMPSCAEEVWPDEWKNACAALVEAEIFLGKEQ